MKVVLFGMMAWGLVGHFVFAENSVVTAPANSSPIFLLFPFGANTPQVVGKENYTGFLARQDPAFAAASLYLFQECNRKNASACAVPFLGVCTAFLLDHPRELWTAAHCFPGSRGAAEETNFLLLDQNLRVVLDTAKHGTGRVQSAKQRFDLARGLHWVDDAARIHLPCRPAETVLSLAIRGPSADEMVMLHVDDLAATRSMNVLAKEKVMAKTNGAGRIWSVSDENTYQFIAPSILFLQNDGVRTGCSGGPVLNSRTEVVGLLVGAIEERVDFALAINQNRLREIQAELPTLRSDFGNRCP